MDIGRVVFHLILTLGPFLLICVVLAPVLAVFRIRVTVPTVGLVSITLTCISWLWLQPFHATAAVVFALMAYSAFLLARGPRAYPRYARRVLFTKESLRLHTRIPRRLSFHGRLERHAVIFALIATWVTAVAHEWFWIRGYNGLKLLILGCVSFVFGCSLAFLVRRRANCKKVLALAESTEVHPVDLVSTIGWLIVLAGGLLCVDSVVGGFDRLLTVKALAAASLTQDVERLPYGAAGFALAMASGVGVSQKKNWGRLLYTWFTPLVLFLAYWTDPGTSASSIILATCVLVYIGTLFYLRRPKIKGQFIRERQDARRVLGMVLLGLATFVLMGGVWRTGSFLYLIWSRDVAQPALVLLVFYGVGGLIGWLASLCWGSGRDVVGMLLLLLGAPLMLNATYMVWLAALISTVEEQHWPSVRTPWSLITCGRYLVGVPLTVAGYVIMKEKLVAHMPRTIFRSS